MSVAKSMLFIGYFTNLTAGIVATSHNNPQKGDLEHMNQALALCPECRDICTEVSTEVKDGKACIKLTYKTPFILYCVNGELCFDCSQSRTIVTYIEHVHDNKEPGYFIRAFKIQFMEYISKNKELMCRINNESINIGSLIALTIVLQSIPGYKFCNAFRFILQEGVLLPYNQVLHELQLKKEAELRALNSAKSGESTEGKS